MNRSVTKTKRTPKIPFAQQCQLAHWLATDGRPVYEKLESSGSTILKQTRNKMFEEIGQSLSPPIQGSRIATWYASIRGDYGRLTNPNSLCTPNTKRKKWIVDTFSFFGDSIIRRNRNKSLNKERRKNENKAPILSNLLISGEYCNSERSTPSTEEHLSQDPLNLKPSYFTTSHLPIGFLGPVDQQNSALNYCFVNSCFQALVTQWKDKTLSELLSFLDHVRVISDIHLKGAY